MRRVREAAPYSSAPAATCSVKPGAEQEPQQQQFLQTQGPVARENTRTATQILRAGNSPPPYRYAFPVMGSGESSPMDLGGAKRSRSPSAASPVAFCLLFRHGKRRSPPAGGEISRVQRTQSEPCPLIRLALRPATFPQGEGLKRTGGETPPEKQKNAPALALNDQRGRVLILGKKPEQPVRTGRSRPQSSAACVCGPVWCRPHSPAG